MPGKPKKPTIKQEYEKEIKRLQRFITKAEKQGFTFESDVIPKRPKRITRASVNRLAKIKPSTLYAKSTYKTETGQIVSGTKGKEIVKATRSKASSARDNFYKGNKGKTYGASSLPSYTDEVLANVEDMINNWTPDSRWSEGLSDYKKTDKNILRNVLAGRISAFGRDTVAKNLESANKAMPGSVEAVVGAVLYGSGSKYAKDGRAEVQNNLKLFMEMTQGSSLTKEQAENISYLVDDMSAYTPDTE